MPVRPSPRPITRTSPPRAPHASPGVSRLMEAMRPVRHQMVPGACQMLAIIWSDLHDVRDPGQLEDLVVRRLALPANRRYLVGVFDSRDRVGPPRDAVPVDHPSASPPALRPLHSPPAGLEASP